MADTKTSALTELTTVDPAADWLFVVDASDTTLGAGGTNKKAKPANIFPVQAVNTVYSGPSSGGSATATFRSLVAADIPSLAASKITSGQLAVARGGTGADLSATGGTGQILKQATSGGVVSVATITAAELPTTGLTITSWSSAFGVATHGGTTTYDLGAFSRWKHTLLGNSTLALSNATASSQFTIKLIQDGTGSRTVTWFSGITWATTGNVAPTLSTAPGACDLFTFMTESAGVYTGLIVAQGF